MTLAQDFSQSQKKMTKQKNKVVDLKQHPFWDKMNEIEMHAVLFIQKIFFVQYTIKFWKKLSYAGSSHFISLLPTICYAFGYEETARKLAGSLMCYALFSSIGKYVVRRRRPGTYEQVFSSPTTSMAAFPSRHTMGMTVIAAFTPFKVPLAVLMAIDRILMGKHFQDMKEVYMQLF